MEHCNSRLASLQYLLAEREALPLLVDRLARLVLEAVVAEVVLGEYRNLRVPETAETLRESCILVSTTSSFCPSFLLIVRVVSVYVVRLFWQRERRRTYIEDVL